MKRFALLTLLLLLLSLPMTGIQAVGVESGPQALARYFSGDTVLFLALRTDDAYLEELNTIVQRVGAQLPAGTIPTTSLRDLIDQGLQSAGFSYDDVRAWLGDSVAVGALDTDGSEGFAVVQLADRAAFEAFVTEVSQVELTPTEANGYTVYTADGTSLYVTNEVLVVPFTNSPDAQPPALPISGSLAEDADFIASLNGLPAENYNMLVYFDGEALREQALTTSTPELESFIEGIGSLSIGATILDERSLVLDTAQLLAAPPESFPPAIDPSFAQYIPANASAVIHGTDFTGLYNNVLPSLTAVAEASGDPTDIEAQIEQGLAMVGIDLQADLLSWTTGDYALFARAETAELIRSIAAVGTTGGTVDPALISDNASFGLVIEATDPAAAQAFYQKIDTLVQQALAQAGDDVTLGTAEIGGTTVTTIAANIPVDPSTTLTVEFVLGASDEVFILATRDAADTILTGDGTLANNPAFQEAQQYGLSSPTSFLYADANGLALTFAPFALAVAGPAIGNVFEEMADSLSTSYVFPTDAVLQDTDPVVEQQIQIYENVLSLLSSSSISSTVTADGAIQLRAVLTLSE